ncbi:NYN domain-containing protein [Paenibacillus sp. 2KB_22]|uniref:NYN domain-containing protein n=1 Tax=Paenibacillus sp. 2KB_22 TaxID=3232978 RepID=UPI003F9ABCB9
MTRTVLFVDYDNVNITLSENYERYDRKNIQEEIVPRIIAEYDNDQVLFTRAYLDFNNIKISSEGYQMFMEKLVQLVHVYKGKNTSDISLIIDVLKSIYLEKIEADKYVIASSDSDMLPVIKELKTLGKEIELLYFEVNTNVEYANLLPKFGVNARSIESLLGINKYESNDNSQFNEIDTFSNILELINEVIIKAHKEYKRDGRYCGTCNKKILKDQCISEKIFIKQDITDGFAIDYLVNNGIIYEYETPNGYKTILISSDPNKFRGIELKDKIVEENFAFLLDKV